MLDLAIC